LNEGRTGKEKFFNSAGGSIPLASMEEREAH